MPSIKLKSKAQEVKSGFEPYDGPEPTKRGFYRSVIKKLQYGKNNSGSFGFFIVLELEAAKGDPKDHSRFDGYPMFARGIITETADGSALKEGAQRNLDNLLAALKSGEDPAVVLAKGDPSAAYVDVLKIGGKAPVGAVVNVDMGFENYNGEQRPQVAGLFPFKDEGVAKAGKAKVEFEDDEDEDDEADLIDEEASEEDERAEELAGLKIAELKTIAKELGVGISGTKEALIERILDAEFGDEAAALDDDEEPDDEEEDEPEEDEEEEEEDESAERREELEGFDRIALKKILKEVAPDFTVLKRHTDADLVDAILDVEFGEETPF